MLGSEDYLNEDAFDSSLKQRRCIHMALTIQGHPGNNGSPLAN